MIGTSYPHAFQFALDIKGNDAFVFNHKDSVLWHVPSQGVSFLICRCRCRLKPSKCTKLAADPPAKQGFRVLTGNQRQDNLPPAFPAS